MTVQTTDARLIERAAHALEVRWNVLGVHFRPRVGPASAVERHGCFTFVVLRGLAGRGIEDPTIEHRGVLAVYRLANDGVLSFRAQWPAALRSQHRILAKPSLQMLRRAAMRRDQTLRRQTANSSRVARYDVVERNGQVTLWSHGLDDLRYVYGADPEVQGLL